MTNTENQHRQPWRSVALADSVLGVTWGMPFAQGVHYPQIAGAGAADDGNDTRKPSYVSSATQVMGVLIKAIIRTPRCARATDRIELSKW